MQRSGVPPDRSKVCYLKQLHLSQYLIEKRVLPDFKRLKFVKFQSPKSYTFLSLKLQSYVTYGFTLFLRV